MPAENNFENMIVQAMPPLQQIQDQICPVVVPTGIVTLDMSQIPPPIAMFRKDGWLISINFPYFLHLQ